MNTRPVSSTPPNQVKSKQKELKTDDFIKMMLTQLQNQDPLEPTKNQELMAQMSQISQLEASTQLQTTLKALAMQSQIGAAGNLIGKMVEGLDAQNESIRGLVCSVRVEKDKVHLELDNGKTLSMDRVSSISPAPQEVVSGS